MILVTGANGFVGKGLCRRLHHAGMPVTAAVRRRDSELDSICTKQTLLDLNGHQDFKDILAGCRIVMHLAARVHVMHDTAVDPLAAFRAVNVDATLHLARQAALQGVKRFVFVSSAKVNGEATYNRPFSAFDLPCPVDAYAVSKWEAEQGITQIAQKTGMEVVIVRPPLVYGPGVRANFSLLMRLIATGLPLPFGRIQNRRSMVALDNLAGLLMTCSDHPSAANQTFLVSDDQDMSTPELVRMLAEAMNKGSLLFSIPPSVLSGAAWLARKRQIAERLLNSLELDISHTKDTLQWQPSVSVRQALQDTVNHFLSHRPA